MLPDQAAFRPRRRVLLAALLGLPIVRPRPATAGTVLAATPIARLDLPWWRERHLAKLAELKRAKPNLIFLGDSITQNWERDGPEPWYRFVPVWERFYGGRNAVNLGFKGDTTASLLWRIENGEVDGIAPKVAVILIGANNLGRLHWPAADTLLGIDAIIARLRRRLPTTRLLLLSVLPSERSEWATETTVAINRGLAHRYDGDPAVTFLDLTGVFVRNGRFDRDLFLDPKLTPPDPPLHPSPKGLGSMAAAMEPVLAKLLGDTPRQ